MYNKLEELEEKLAYKFNNINLLVIALTHKSYAYENAKEAKTEYNERLEFLRDAILEHTISDLLFKDKNKFKANNFICKIKVKAPDIDWGGDVWGFIILKRMIIYKDDSKVYTYYYKWKRLQ